MKKNKIFVSIIVPVYNAEKYLTLCIDSILKQTYKEFELILVDDGSTDSSGQICDKYAGIDKRVHCIHKRNGGVSSSRYQGLQNSMGDWIMFVDNDDTLQFDMLEQMVALISDDLDIITSATTVEDAGKRKSIFSVDKRISGKEFVSLCFQNEIIWPLWGKLYRKEWFLNLELDKYKNKVPTLFLEDILITPIGGAKARKVLVLKTPFYNKRNVNDSISKGMKMSSYFWEQIEVMNIRCNYFRQTNIKNAYSDSLKGLMRALGRNYCLMNEEQMGKNEYKRWIELIEKYKKAWFSEYWKYSGDSIFNKLFFTWFLVMPKSWRILTLRFYKFG